MIQQDMKLWFDEKSFPLFNRKRRSKHKERPKTEDKKTDTEIAILDFGMLMIFLFVTV